MSRKKSIFSLVLALTVILSGVMTLFPDTVLAQSGSFWAMNFGGTNQDHANSVRQTSDGGYIVAGFTESFGAGDEDTWILKLASDGTTQWQKTYGGSGVDRARSIQPTTDGGYIVAGFTESFGAGDEDIWILKLASDGTTQWQKTYGGGNGDRARFVKQTSDGGYIVAGSTQSFGAGKGDFWILKLASNGNVEWQKTYGGSDWDLAYSVQQTSDGGYIVAGYTASFGAGDDDFWILKLSSNGTVEWQKTYGGNTEDDAYSVQQTSDGGYIVAGYTASFGAGDDDFWILKLSSNGTVEWQKTYGGASWEFALFIQQTSDDGYIVTGETWSFGAGESDFWILKLTSDGNAQWQKTYGGNTYDDVESIQETSDGGFIMAGATESFGAGDEDLWVLRLNENGSIPECSLGVESNITIMNTQSTEGDTAIDGYDTIASVSMPSYSMLDTSCITDTQCSYYPTVIDEPSAEDGFASIAPFLETAYGFKAGEGVEGWTTYNPSWPSIANTLSALYVARGYWIYVSEACILQFGSSVYVLDVGWNLIGWIPQL